MPSKAMELYERIKEDVIRLRFRADEIINEKDLAEQHGVSKTPVREALSMLVQEGYLKKIPRVGYLLRELSEEEYAKLIYLRYTLEKSYDIHQTAFDLLSYRHSDRSAQRVNFHASLQTIRTIHSLALIQ